MTTFVFIDFFCLKMLPKRKCILKFCCLYRTKIRSWKKSEAVYMWQVSLDFWWQTEVPCPLQRSSQWYRSFFLRSHKFWAYYRAFNTFFQLDWKLVLYEISRVLNNKPQCARTDLNKRLLPKSMTTTGWKAPP